MYKFITQSNTYEEYEIVETKTFKLLENSILPKTPYELKLLANDTFCISGNNIVLEHSIVRSNQYLSGILDLSVTHGKKKNKFLYLCKPDDKRLPYFLVPYDIPYNFDKSIRKLYITFMYDSWDGKYPVAKITQNLGNINDLVNYYEYILYCKSLHHSLSNFNKATKNALKNCQYKPEDVIEDITIKYNIKKVPETEHIFTIDSSNSNDFDDALSFCKEENRINIYITDVSIIMDHLNLWESFSNRISSIYLPDKKRSMIPANLTDAFCSLKEGTRKICYCLSIFYDENNEPEKHEINICNVHISNNYSYLNEERYSNLDSFKSMQKILKSKSSKDVVTKLMLYFNHHIARSLVSTKKGIFKSLNQTGCRDIPESLPDNIYNHILLMRNQASLYTLYDKQIYKSAMHKDIDVYLQASSPMRRLVDTLNNIIITTELCHCNLSVKAHNFYSVWTCEEKLNYINTASRAIRKIKSKCKIYHQHEMNKLHNIEPIYEGYLFDRIIKEGDGKFQYMVYLPAINLTTYITLLDEYENYTKHFFKLYVFVNEESDKKKIKLQICYESS